MPRERLLPRILGLLPRIFPDPRRHPWRYAVAMLLSFAVLLGLAWLLDSWHLATRVRVSLVADRLAFTLAGDRRATILEGGLPFEELMIQRLERLTFHPEHLRLLAPPTDLGRQRTGGGAHLVARDHGASLLLRPLGSRAAQLGALETPPGARMILELRRGQPPELTVKVDVGQEIGIAAGGRLRIDGVSVVLEAPAGDLPSHGSPLAAAELGVLELEVAPAPDRLLTVESRPEGISLAIATPAARPFTGRPFPIRELELLRQDLDGQVASSLVRSAELSYPDASYRPAVTVSEERFLILEDLRGSELTLGPIDREDGGITAVFDGRVGGARAGTERFAGDLRLTALQWLLHHRLKTIAAAVLAFLVQTAAFLGLGRQLVEGLGWGGGGS